MSDLPVVCIFGVQNVELKSEPSVPGFETNKFDCRCYLTDDDLDIVLAKDRPDVVATFGDKADFKNVAAASTAVRSRWVHFDNTRDLEGSGRKVFDAYMRVATQSKPPMVSVFTPAFNSGARLMRPYASLCAQSHKDWEWVVVDDSTSPDTFKFLMQLAEHDCRVRPIKPARHSGKIGGLKRMACRMSEGDVLVELDHDDEITDWALSAVADAFVKHPEVGFVYTDFAECFEDGRPFTYGPKWGLGYGSYRDESWNGRFFKVVNSPNINPKTIRHIVAAPNHIRAWRKTVYDAIGGHSDVLHVADDYELMVRSFLKTRMCRVSKLCYIQYRNTDGNTHQVRNKDIQRLVKHVSIRYDKAIHERFVELGVDDPLYKEGEPTFHKLGHPNPSVESHCTILA